MPTGGVLLWGIFASLFTKFKDGLAEIATATFIFEMEVLRALMPLRKTVLCLNLHLLCYSNTLLALKTCPILNTPLLHKVNMASVNKFHLMGLVEYESVSYVEARQKKYG